MKFNEHIYPYLKGDQFSSSLGVDLRQEKYPAISREEKILDITRDSAVIHVGCTDHLEIIDKKIEGGNWLHKLLTEQCNRCFGIDLNKESIDYLINELEYTNVQCGNILTDTFPVVDSQTWDFALFGEIVEHLDNPVEFLSTFREKYQKNVKRFIITVPNILNRAHFKEMLNFRELINSDHRFWFTPYTISKVIAESGMTPEHIHYANRIALSQKELIARKLKKAVHAPLEYPFYYFNSLIVTGTL